MINKLSVIFPNSADILLVDKYSELLGRPWLTTVIDTYSRCIVGFNLDFDAPSSQVMALALRHAILPKQYGHEYQLNEEWGTYGKPEHFYTDGGKDFHSNHLQQISVQLGFVCHLRDCPSEGGIIERPFKKHQPIRLCGACYSEEACHKMEWQLKTTQFCSKHELTLLSECPNCGARFKVSAL